MLVATDESDACPHTQTHREGKKYQCSIKKKKGPVYCSAQKPNSMSPSHRFARVMSSGSCKWHHIIDYWLLTIRTSGEKKIK